MKTIKKYPKYYLTHLLWVVVLVSCQIDNETSPESQIPEETLQVIEQAGFSIENVKLIQTDHFSAGYLVEGDIILHDHDLESGYDDSLRIGKEEHYRTPVLPSRPPVPNQNNPRVVRIYMGPTWSSRYINALDQAIARYNALNLRLVFQRSTRNNSATYQNDISILVGNGPYLGAAGFPSIVRDIYPTIYLNPNVIDSPIHGNAPLHTIASIIAHEIGHCIGFRHTDYMNRRYSCGIETDTHGNILPANEGGTALHISNTPTGPDTNSWMLACIGFGENRPFTSNDIVALNQLFSR